MTASTRKPVAFDLDAFEKSLKLEPFTFVLGGKQRTLPHTGMLTMQQGLDMEHGKIGAVLADVSDDETADLIMALASEAGNALLEQWQLHSADHPRAG